MDKVCSPGMSISVWGVQRQCGGVVENFIINIFGVGACELKGKCATVSYMKTAYTHAMYCEPGPSKKAQSGKLLSGLGHAIESKMGIQQEEEDEKKSCHLQMVSNRGGGGHLL